MRTPRRVDLRRPGYQLSYRLVPDEPPDEALRSQAVSIRTGEDPLPATEEVLARIGRYRITLHSAPDQPLLPPGTLPLVSQRRGGMGGAGRAGTIGLDTAVWTRRRAVPEDAAGKTRTDGTPEASLSHLTAPGMEGRISARRRTGDGPKRGRITIGDVLDHLGALAARWVVPPRERPVVVAVIDGDHNREGEDMPWRGDERVLDVEEVRLPWEKDAESDKLGHGDSMVTVVHEALREGRAQYRIRRIEIAPGQPFLQPMSLAAAIARAAAPRENGEARHPPADVIVIGLSYGHWGMPLPFDVALTEAARRGRSGLGAVIVCSSGNRGSTMDGDRDPDFPYGSVAIGGDELAAHPDVLTVSSCDMEGRWLRNGGSEDDAAAPRLPHSQIRSEMSMDSRLGPSVAVSAPAMQVDMSDKDDSTPDDRLLFDGSSLSAALAAAAAARVLQANPWLAAHEIRHLLSHTTLVPPSPDHHYGAESAGNSAVDRVGHNFKIGFGTVSFLTATLAARDPVCQVLLEVAPPAPPPPTATSILAQRIVPEPTVLISRWFDHWVRTHTEHHPLVAAYEQCRGLLSRAVLRSLSLREELRWLCRHLLAIFTYDGSHNWFSSDGAQVNHGVLLRRLVHLAETLEQVVEDASEAANFVALFRTLTARLEELDTDGSDIGSRELERFLLAAFLGYPSTPGEPDPDGQPLPPVDILLRPELEL